MNAVAVWSWSTWFDSCVAETRCTNVDQIQASNVRGQGEEEGLSIAVRFFFSLMIIFFFKKSVVVVVSIVSFSSSSSSSSNVFQSGVSRE